MSGVKVAVRVRPFNSREMAREAESIITSKNLKRPMMMMMSVIVIMLMIMSRSPCQRGRGQIVNKCRILNSSTAHCTTCIAPDLNKLMKAITL